MKTFKEMRFVRTFVAVLMLGLFVGEANAQRPMHEIHSMMLYNFMKYVNWPASVTSGDFVIGVIGEDDVFGTLTQWYGAKSKGSQKIVIKKFNSPSDISGCHVLYVGSKSSGDFDAILAAISGKPTLTVTDRAGLGKKGSCINFKTVGGKLKFELNQAAVTGANLQVSSQLTGMAILI